MSNSIQAIRHIIYNAGAYDDKDKLLIIYDDLTKSIADHFINYMVNSSIEYVSIQNSVLTMHGQEPDSTVAKLMKSSDLILCLTSKSLAHSNARHVASINGARFLSMPDFSMEMLFSDAILVDYEEQSKYVDQLADILDKGKVVTITSAIGTNLTLDINNRSSNRCPGVVKTAGQLGSPPDIECNVAPNEEMTYGKLIVDGSIPCDEIGLLNMPIIIEITGGKINKILSEDNETLDALKELMGPINDHNSKLTLAEFGIGMNPLASLTGNMLTDEGAFNTVHFGFGSNSTIGGKNKVNFHLDMVIMNPTVFIDDMVIIKNGIHLYRS